MSDVLFIKESSVFKKEKLITCHDLKNSEKVTLSGHLFPQKKNLFKAQVSSHTSLFFLYLTIQNLT